MEKNNILIDDLDMHGFGIAHSFGKTFFVKNALPGEIISAKLDTNNNNVIDAKDVSIISESASRVKPLCPYFLKCGGCDIQHFCYNQSLNFKKQQIKLAFKKICAINLDDFEIEKSPNEYFYRNKIAMKICKIDNKNVLCYYKSNSHEPIKIDSCKIANKNFDIVIKCTNDYLEKLNLDVFNAKTKTGALKHLVARIVDNKLLLTFVVNEKKNFENIEKLYFELLKHFKSVGINQNINKFEKQILSDKFEDLIGKNVVEDENFGIVGQITNASFLQVNTFVANKMYEYVSSKVCGNIVNCYSGAGLLSAIIANKNKDSLVQGIEINKNATLLANNLAKQNNIKNQINLCGDAGCVLKNLKLKNFSLVVDPPKSGLDKNMIDCILKFLPQKIVYVSCNKTSLAKNFNSLKEKYKIEEIKAFDMFPQTVNVETVLILSKI